MVNQLAPDKKLMSLLHRGVAEIAAAAWSIAAGWSCRADRTKIKSIEFLSFTSKSRASINTP
jgi:hypothetical protein